MPEFEIGFSPCPNDTFIFDALINHKIDTKGYIFKVHLEDVQTLNEWAITGKLPFSKISYGVWPLVKNKYSLLNSGGALGKGVGPLLIYKEDFDKNGVIDANDRQIVGQPTPKYTWGVTNSFKYKGFDLSVFVYQQVNLLAPLTRTTKLPQIQASPARLASEFRGQRANALRL